MYITPYHILVLILILALIIIISGIILAHTESWKYGDAVYVTIQVVTGLGLGDIVPTSSEGKLWTSLVALFALGTYFIIVGFIVAYLTEKDIEKVKHE